MSKKQPNNYSLFDLFVAWYIGSIKVTNSDIIYIHNCGNYGSAGEL